MKKYVIAIDQGTQSTRLLVVDKNKNIILNLQKEIPYYIEDNQILQDPNLIYESVKSLLDEVFNKYFYKAEEVASIGITNQRETTLIWDRHSKKSLYPAISWQSQHTKDICSNWIRLGYEDEVYEKTGLKINPYFSASKINYILSKVEIDQNTMFGTIDTYLLYMLSGVHKTDVTNASRTMLFNIETLKWDDDLLKKFEIPKHILPEVFPSNHLFGYYKVQNINIPINAIMGDQQSSLFGHLAFNKGDIKNTYGTGCFALLNIGSEIIRSKKGLLTTIAWQINNEVTYALEGTVFMAGAIMKWLRDKVGIIDIIENSENYAKSARNEVMYFVPAFLGLGTPYWDSHLKASFLGIDLNTTKNDFIKSALDSIAYQTNDLIESIEEDINIKLDQISVDGGAASNKYLMQFQADILQKEIIKVNQVEKTALGISYLSGLTSGLYKDIEFIKQNNNDFITYKPKISIEQRNKLLKGWKRAILAAKTFKGGED